MKNKDINMKPKLKKKHDIFISLKHDRRMAEIQLRSLDI